MLGKVFARKGSFTMGTSGITRSDLLKRGVHVEATLPGMLAVEASKLLATGEFGSLDEFLLVAVGSYLDMRAHPDVHGLLQLRMMQDAIASNATPRSYEQGLADVMSRLDRPLPMSSAEAIAAVA
jgi:hypothetical protein